MNTGLLVQAAFRRLNRYRAKSFLMGFGILISVFALVVVQCVSAGIRDAFERFVERAYPSDTVVLVAGSGPMGGGAGRTNLRLADVEALAGSVGGIALWDPMVTAGMRDIRQGANHLRASLLGYSERAETANRRAVEEGEFFSADQIRRSSRVALIGATTAERLFPEQSPIGETIFIENSPYEIIGVLERVGVDPHGNDQDNTVHVPYTTLMNQILHVDYVSSVTFVAQNRGEVESVGREIAEALRAQHQIGKGDDDDFSVLTAVFLQKLLDETFQTFNIFIPLIGGLIFVIAGLVVLGIMLISIRERTAEIGLRKAVGAKPADLQLQVVLEVLIVSAVAAIAGFVLAFATIKLITPMLAAKFGVASIGVPPLTVLVAVGSALAIGLLGALLPARRAGRMNAVDALR